MSSVALKFAVVVGIAVALLLIVPALLKPMQQNAAHYHTARLFNYVSEGDIQKVRLALDAGADVNVTRIFNPDIGPVEVSVLEYAARQGKTEIAGALLEAGASPAGIANTQPDAGRRSPLYWAALGGHQQIIDLLIEHGADPDAVIDGKTAEEWAVADGETEAAELLRALQGSGADQSPSVGDEQLEPQAVEAEGERP